MKKRILSILLAVLMLISVLPVTAMAADGSTDNGATAEQTKAVSAETTDKSVHVNKSISEDGTKLTLEAFATNTVSTETTYDPLDIVLVLDVSGSMRDCINCNATYDYHSYIVFGEWKWSNDSEYCQNQPKYVYERQGLAKDLGKDARPLYRASRDGYSEVEWCNGSHVFSSHQPGWYEDGLFSHSRVSDNTILYKQVKVDRIKHQHRIDALKAAVGDFIDSVATQKDSEGNTINNRISLVTFASNANTVKGLTSAQSGSTELKAAVKNLTANGATQADLGMTQAQSVLNGRTGNDANRKSVVILFTDGEPTSGSSFESGVASGAITAANALKAGGTTVFTVGIFKGANPAADPGSDNTNKYMHAVSSNYPGATYKKSQGSYKWNFGERATGDYYLAASDANGLNAVFQAISNEVNSLTAKIDTTSVLSDTLSGAFTFDAPQNAEYSGITVAKYPVKGMENGVYTWGAAEELTIGEGEGKVQVKVTGKKLEVTGFDYGTNAVTTKEGSTELKGYKLVVTIPIKPDTNYSDWQQDEHYYDTNASAGLSYGENNGQKLALNESPKAPVTAYSVTYTDGVENAEIFADQVSTVLPGTATPAFSDGTPTRENYKFNGWSPAVADTVTGNVTYTAQWEELTYTVTYTDGVDGEEIFKDQVTGNLKSGDKTPAFSGGTPTRENYEFNGWSPAVAETVTDNATYTATWTEKQVQKYKVTYQYPDTKPESATPPTDDTQYTVGQEYTLQTVTAPEGWTFDGWYKSYDNSTNTFSDEVTSSTENKMVEGGVTLYGKWTAPAEMFTVSYKFVSADGTTLPFEVTTKKPGSKQVAKDTTETPATFADVSVTGGTWKFNGWTPASHTITSNFEFIGTWEFKKTEQPPETKYEITLTISKKLMLRSGSHPGEQTFLFVVSYYNAGEEKFEYAGEFSITLQNGWDHINETVTVTVDEDAYYAILRGARVRVVERDLGENGFEYDTTPRFGRFGYIIITDSGIVGNNVPGEIAPLPINPDDSNFNFVNYYGKSGKVEKPAKVSPQLNRDDHVAYIMGYPDGNARPEGEITRAEACTIFFRLLTKESRDYYFSRTNDYTDVSRTDWFNNAISTLSNAGIVTGYADGTFRPDQPITRGEMAKIIANFARLGGATKSFTDLSGHWAKSYVELAAGNGWIAGYPDGTFGPDRKITRAETVTMINRVLERVPAKESRLLSRSIMLTFPDNEPGEWYYIAVQEASNSHTYQRSAYETAGDEMWLRLIENVDWTKLEK